MSVTLSLRGVSNRAIGAAQRDAKLAAMLMLASATPGGIASSELPPNDDQSPRAITKRSAILDARRDNQKHRNAIEAAGLSLDADLGEHHHLGSGVFELEEFLDLLGDPHGNLFSAGTDCGDGEIRLLDPKEVHAAHAALVTVGREEITMALRNRGVPQPRQVRNPFTGQTQQVTHALVLTENNLGRVWPLFEKMRSIVGEVSSASRGLVVWTVH